MTSLTLSQRTLQLPRRHPRSFLVVSAAAWWMLYQSLIPASEALVAALPVDRGSHLGRALQFFFYDTPKVLLLLTAVVLVMGIVNTYFTPERTRALLAGRRHGMANVLAATLGVVTPFCSCSSVPLFIGFVQAGVPLGVTFSFLITAPMVDTVALTLLFSLFGWKVALLYLGFGMLLGIVAGLAYGCDEAGAPPRSLGARDAAGLRPGRHAAAHLGRPGRRGPGLGARDRRQGLALRAGRHRGRRRHPRLRAAGLHGVHHGPATRPGGRCRWRC